MLVPLGIDLPMAVGAIAMSVSAIIVAANAQLLRGLRLRREPISLEPRRAPADPRTTKGGLFTLSGSHSETVLDPGAE